MTHHHHDREVVERDSSAGLVIGILVALLVLFLVWAIFFSGWVIDRDEAETPTNIERREEGDTNIIVPDEGDQTDGGTTDDTTNDTTNDTTEPTP